MSATSNVTPETVSLTAHGITGPVVRANLRHSELVEHACRRGEGRLTDRGAFVAVTSPHTGRSPNDKFVVEEAGSREKIWWDKNKAISEAQFEALLADVKAHLAGQPELFVQDLFGGADPAYRLPVRFITPNAWHAHFVRNMFIRPEATDLAGFDPGFVVYHAPELQADPARHGTRTGTFIALNFAKKTVAHRRHPLRRRDEEVDLHRPQLPAPAARRLPDALLRERGTGRRRGDLLRALGHRQDHDLRRSRTAS